MNNLAPVENFFILDDGGKILFNFDFTNAKLANIDERSILTASHLSAVLQFAEFSSNGQNISAFEMEKSKLFLRMGVKIPVIYVILVHKHVKINEKKIKKQLFLIANEFECQFSIYDLMVWDGRCDFFKDFIYPFTKIMKILA